MRLLLPLLMIVAVGCASGARDGVTDLDSLRVLRDMDGTHTFSVRDTPDADIGGYIVEFFNAPEGSTDERKWPAGTVLVQNTELRTIGFITRGGRVYRFDDQGASEQLEVSGRHAQIAALLGMTTPLKIRSALHGVEVPSSTKN
ncbi:MAG: hypothetical protein DHS20C15_11100 [Planctomycetota bacterium]|nr:MAG: hypothetical protein DHS20C15_11100 [Planctomycetota bacterium]